MRKIFSFLISTMLLLTLFTTTVFAVTVDSVAVDGKNITLDAPLKQYGDSNWIPLSSVVKSLGATITWSGDTATIKDKNTTLVLTLNSNKYEKNGKTIYRMVQPTKINDQVYVNLKFIYNILGYTVSLENNSSTVTINTTKPYTLNEYVYNDYTATISFDDTYSFSTGRYMLNPNMTATFVKNMKTGEVKEIYHSRQFSKPIWTRDDKLIFLGAGNDIEKNIPTYMIYDTATSKVSTLGSNSNSSLGVYVQPKNCFIYLSGSKYYSYDLSTNKTTEITKKQYDEFTKIQSDKEGDRNKPYNVYLDGKKLDMETAPQNYRNSLYVPLSFITKELGATVNWTSPNVTIKQGDINLVLTINSNAYTLNGKTYYTQYRPIILNNRTYVPIRFLSNIFGYTVHYENVGQVLKIDTTKKTTVDNSFIDDNSTFTLSPNGEYGYKYEGKATVYFKNMKTGEFKEIYYCTGHFDIEWVQRENKTQLIISGNADPVTGAYGDLFMLYDPATDKIKTIVKAYNGGYVKSLDAFAYSTTVYASDGTTDRGSSFYLRDMKTGKDTKITQDQFYKYIYTPADYEHYLKYKQDYNK